MNSIIITLIIFGLFFISILKSSRKKTIKPVPPPVAEPIDLIFSEDEVEKKSVEEDFARPSSVDSDLENFSPKNSKNDAYFTYEDINCEGEHSMNFSEKCVSENVENISQIVENEKIKNKGLTLDADEIRKGIIYSIILQKPYN